MSRIFLRPAPALAVLFGLSLAGCAAIGSSNDEARAKGGMFNPGAGVGPREAGAVSRGARPVAALPTAAGRIIDVREKRFGNGFTQEIALAADSGVRGENVILVTVRDQPHPPWGEPEVEMPHEREDEIAAEIEKRFSGGSLRIHDTVLRNAYGPYGLASGRIGRMNCVYLWQSLEDLKPHIRAARFSPYKIETAVRVRLCRSGASVAQLAFWASNVLLDTGGVSQAPRVAATYAPSGGDPLDDALGQRAAPRGQIASERSFGDQMFGARTPSARTAGAQDFVGYASMTDATMQETMQEEPAPRRLAAAPRRRTVVRYVRVRRHEARQEAVVEPQQQGQGYAQQGYAQGYTGYAAPAQGYAAAQPGQVIWTQPGAAAFASAAAPAYGASPGAAAASSVGLPPQAYGGPAGQAYIATPR